MARVLVTGAAGFIGSHLALRLLARGDDVVALDSFDAFYAPTLKEENAALVAEAAREHGRSFRLVRGDIRERTSVDEAFGDGVDAVVHLAARAGVRPSIREPALYQSVNVEGTVALFEAARARGVKPFVFASSSSVYGANVKVPFAEDDPVDHPVSPYAATKKAGELLAYTWTHLYGMNIPCLRFFTVYGPRQRPEMAIHLFARAIWEGAPLTVFGDGGTERDYTYIDDIIGGVVAALDKARAEPAGWYRVYNLGESQRVRLSELVALLEKHLGRQAVVRREPEQPGDVPMTFADVSRARAELGYAPQVGIDEGLRRFVAWFKAQREREGGGR